MLSPRRLLNLALLRTAFRDLLRRPWQLVLAVLGVALGVAVVVAIDLANASAERAFERSAEILVGRATHQVVGGPTGVPVEVYRDLRLRWDVPMAPVVEGLVFAVDHGQEPLRVLGVDPFAEAPFRDALDRAATLQPGFERFFLDPAAVLVSQDLAERLGLAPGDHLRVQAGSRQATLTVLGELVPAPGRRAALPEDALLMDVAAAQELLGRVGSLTRVDLILEHKDQAATIESSLPPGLRLVPASEQVSTADQLTAAFRLNLTALSLLALVVGMFLIYNTMTFSVLQRRQVLGVLRALGATADQAATSLLVEAAALSLLGGLVGLGLGWFLGQGAVRLVSRTINDLYFVVAVRQVPLLPATVLKGLTIGAMAGLVAATGPAMEAARVPPVLAMQRSLLEERAAAWVPGVAVAGGLLGLAGAGVLVLGPASLTASFGGMFAVMIGLALLVPLGVALWARLLDRGLGPRLGGLGRIAVRTLTRALSRTGVAIAALMMALSATIGVGLMVASFRDTVTNWLDLTLRADLYVAAPSAGGTRPAPSLPTDLADELAQVPGVAVVETFRAVRVQSELGEVLLSVADARRERDARLYRFAQGSPAEVWEAVLQGAVIVSEPFAFRHGLPLQGGEITLYTEQGPVTFPVVGVFYDYATEQGTVLMSENVFLRYWQDPGLSSVSLYLDPGADLEAVAAEVRQWLSGTGLLVLRNRAVREEALEIFDQTFAITTALRLLSIVVAFIGVMSALLALQVERLRELATLRALGATLPDLWRLTTLETALMGLAAGLFSLPTGYVLALVLAYVINLRSFGWSIRLVPQPTFFVQALLLGLGASLLAAALPIRRLARLPVAEALRLE